MDNNWQLTIYALILHVEETTVFANADGQLPSTEIMAEGWWQVDAGKPIIQNALTELLGLSPIILRRFEPIITDEEKKTAQIVYELDYGKPQCAGGWISAENLINQTHRTIAQTQQTLPNQAPWMRRGWHESAMQWISDQMTAHGRTVRRIEPARSWCISYLAKIYTTSDELFYFKATIDLPLFVKEGAIMAYLNRLYPELVPAPIAFDEARNFFISADFGPVATELDSEARFAMLREIVTMQRKSADKIPDLLANGCIDRRHFLQQITECFQDADAYVGLSEEETLRLKAALPELKRRAQILHDSPLPATLIHGDLHQGNIQLDNEKVTIFDWSDAAVGFPWVDALLVLFTSEEEQTAARDVYLACWESYAPIATLRTLWELWLPLFYIHHAISYFSIFANLDPTTSWELGGNASGFLKRALKYLD